MNKEILLGDEAIALGAIHAGISASFAYPGTPSTEIQEYIIGYARKNGSIHAEWSTNEKSAYETALGVSYIGKRVFTCMKHVGLNVAADAFMNSAITGINGGFVAAVADDPGMHSSQNEQDSRFYADFAKILCLEPSNQQEAYDMTLEAYELSERFKLPVMLRLVTRLSHSRANITVKEPLPQKDLAVSPDWKTWTLLPVIARQKFEQLLKLQTQLISFSNKSDYNKLVIKPGSTTGVIASGIGYNYFMENAENLNVSYLKIGEYPLPEQKIRELAESSEELLIIEDGYPFIERKIKEIVDLCGKKVHGKLDGTLPSTGELNPDLVRNALKLKPNKTAELDASDVILKRLPRFCDGCPHDNTFDIIDQIREIHPETSVFSDIGCYTLAALREKAAIDSCVCMGASVGMAKGAANCGHKYSIGVIGDSTFLHSGIPALMKAASENTPMTLFILDNNITAMTGGQTTPIEGEQIDNLVKGLGVPEEHVKVITPLRKFHEDNFKTVKKEVEYEGLSVIIARRECVQLLKQKKKEKKNE